MIDDSSAAPSSVSDPTLPTKGLQAQLGSCIDAHYPLLVLQSYEQQRAVACVQQVAQTSAVETIVLDPLASISEQLETVRAQSAPCVFIAPDLHRAVDTDPIGIRRLKALASMLQSRSQTLVIVGAHVTLPSDISVDAMVFDLPLPGPAMLAQLLASQCQASAVTITRETAVRAIRSVQGLTSAAASRAFRRALRADDGLRVGSTEGLVDEKRRILQRSDLLEFIETPPSLDDVGGLEDLKEWLGEREMAFDQRARDFGLPTPKGLLLVGVQGCGKSLTAKAVARAWQLPLTRLDFGALFTAGRSPDQNLRRLFRLAEALSPVVLWVDEIDKAFQAVGGDGASEQLSRVFAAFITWMQEKDAPVFVVATANSVDHLPGELLRKGRFDDIFFVDLPNAAERQRILQIHLRKHGRDAGRFDLAGLSTVCEHFSGAELEQVVIAGLYRAFQKRRELGDEDLSIAARGTVPLYRTAEEQIKALREWARSRARRATPDARVSEIWSKGRR